MERVNGRFYGSCYECGNAVDVETLHDEPMVRCIPTKDLVNKYDKGCPFIIPRCCHNERTNDELKPDTPPPKSTTITRVRRSVKPDEPAKEEVKAEK